MRLFVANRVRDGKWKKFIPNNIHDGYVQCASVDFFSGRSGLLFRVLDFP